MTTDVLMRSQIVVLDRSSNCRGFGKRNDGCVSRIVGVLAAVSHLQTVCAVRLLLRTFAFALLAVETAVPRALLRSYDLILACPQPSITLVANWFRLVAFDLLLTTSDTSLVSSKSRLR